MPSNAIAIQLATLSIVGSGLCLMLSPVFTPLRVLAGKLFVIGCVLAAAAAVIPGHIG